LTTLPVAPVMLNRGDMFRRVTAGGDGNDDPLVRCPTMVRDDLVDGTVTVAHAKAAYGVIIAPDHQVNDAATARPRIAIREEANAA